VVKKKFFKTKQEVEIAFEIEPTEAEHVELLCEANGWEPIQMKKNKDGSFRTKLRVPKEQQFQFRYLVDHTTWVNDETADAYCVNEFGGQNGVLDTTQGG
jgi:1,4-alpha-glucan branching enzyme